MNNVDTYTRFISQFLKAYKTSRRINKFFKGAIRSLNKMTDDEKECVETIIEIAVSTSTIADKLAGNLKNDLKDLGFGKMPNPNPNHLNNPDSDREDSSVATMPGVGRVTIKEFKPMDVLSNDDMGRKKQSSVKWIEDNKMCIRFTKAGCYMDRNLYDKLFSAYKTQVQFGSFAMDDTTVDETILPVRLGYYNNKLCLSIVTHADIAKTFTFEFDNKIDMAKMDDEDYNYFDVQTGFTVDGTFKFTNNKEVDGVLVGVKEEKYSENIY